MPTIIAASHALPPHRARQSDVRETIERLFSDRVPEIDRLLSVFDHARIEERQFMRPLEWYLDPPSTAGTNLVYQTDGFDLLQRSARQVLDQGEIAPGEIDHVIFVSSTGLATPTLDARLIQSLGLDPGTTRLPVWGLGCAAGAAGLARARDYCLGHPGAMVLLVALECCSLTFLPGDDSKKNLVASAIFADGAAAVLVAGDDRDGGGVRMIASASHLFRDSGRIMGWDFMDKGMQLVLSPRLPALVKQELPPLLDRFLKRSGCLREDLAHYVTHPGGARVIDAYREALNLGEEDLAITEEVLRRHGNISSVSVLMVLEKWLSAPVSTRRGKTLLSAFGPGFSAEMLLLEV